jgi:hypothetical protein
MRKAKTGRRKGEREDISTDILDTVLKDLGAQK